MSHDCLTYLDKLPSIVILRDPVTRYISSFYYRIKRFKNNEIIKNWLSEKSINNPSNFLNYLMDTNDFSNPIISLKANNQRYQKVFNNKFDTCYTFQPQSLWIKKPPKVVFIMKELNMEWDYFCDKYQLPIQNLPHHNSSRKSLNKKELLNKSQIDYLKILYKEDFQNYKKYQSIDFKERI